MPLKLLEALRTAEAASALIASLPTGLALTAVGRRFNGASRLSARALIAGAIFTTAASLSVWSLTGAPVSRLLIDLGLGWTLLLLAAIDVAALRLPDIITIPLAVAGLCFAESVSATLPERFIGLAVGTSTLAALDLLYGRLRHRAGIGLGDAKLLGAAGAWLGWRALPSVLLIGCAGALVWVAVRILARGRSASGEAIPFGAPLCLALGILWLFHD